MSVYVDSLQEWGWKMYGRTIASCHMVADSRAELHSMASKIGLLPHHIQTSALGNHHFDLTPTRRAKAVKLGAVELDRLGFVKKCRELRGAPPLHAARNTPDSGNER